MTIDTFDPLEGFRPYELGCRSPRPLVHAVMWAREGWNVYAECADKATASTDLRALRDAYNADVLARLLADESFAAREVGFRVRSSSGDGLIALYFPRARDLNYCQQDLGKLPATRVITRDNGSAFYIFQSPVCAPEFQYGHSIVGTRAVVRADFPLPGAIDRQSKEVWRYRDGHDFSNSLAILPRSFLFAIPSKSNGLSATPALGDDSHSRYSTLTRGD